MALDLFKAVRYGVTCSRCFVVLREGHGPHAVAICCQCRDENFPDDPKAGDGHDFVVVDMEHDQDAQPTGYNYTTEQVIETVYSIHAKIEECQTCGLKVTGEFEDCDCGPTDDDPPDDDDRDPDPDPVDLDDDHDEVGL